MNGRHSRSSRVLRVTFFTVVVLSAAASASPQAAGDGLSHGRSIATIGDDTLTKCAGAKRDSPIGGETLERPPVLREAVSRESIRSQATRLALRSAGEDRQPGTPSRGWVQRHPALAGALVGAGLGAVSSIPRWNELYCATGGDEDCLFHGPTGVLFGAGAGAGIGALIGHFTGK